MKVKTNCVHLTKTLLCLSLAFLFACGPPPPERIRELTHDLSSQDSGTKNKAALELGRIGSAAEPAVPSLVRLLDDENRGVQSSAAFALRKIDSPEARQALENAVRKNR